MPEITTFGLDLAKNMFLVHGADAQGRAVLRKKLRRDHLWARSRRFRLKHLHLNWRLSCRRATLPEPERDRSAGSSAKVLQNRVDCLIGESERMAFKGRQLCFERY